VIVAMFFREPATGYKAPVLARSLVAGLILAILGTLYLGIMPGRVLDALERARDQITTAKR